jgi:hypothetical protein
VQEVQVKDIQEVQVQHHTHVALPTLAVVAVEVLAVLVLVVLQIELVGLEVMEYKVPLQVPQNIMLVVAVELLGVQQVLPLED